MKIAGYGRVSTLGQVKDGTSLEDQRNIIEDRCKKDGLELYNFYSDEGVSGGTLDRPALQQLIVDAKAKLFESVYYTRLDRMGRSVRDIHNLFHELHNVCGVDLVCIEDPSLNTGGKMGAVMLGMLSTFAQFERDMIRERTLAGKAAKWDRGEIVTGELPFGYQKNKVTAKPEIIEEQASVYRKIVKYYLDQRLSMKDIAIRLTEEHIPTPSTQKGKKRRSERWNSTVIGDILKQPAYKGEAVYNRNKPESEWIKVPFPPLISENDWQQIQDRIVNQRHKPKRIFKEYADHFLLDGFIYCGECGSKMRKRIKRESDGKKRCYYTCYWRKTNKKELALAGRTSPCNLKSVNADLVDEQILLRLADMLTTPDKYIAEWLRDQNADELANKVDNLTKKEKQLRQKLAKGFQWISSETDPSVKDIYVKEQRKVQQEWKTTKSDLRHTLIEFEFVRDKLNRYEQFTQTIEKSTKNKHRGSKFKIKSELQSYIFNLPFLEKKRLVEAIVSPENGGRCTVAYIRPIDFLDVEERKDLSSEELRMPLEDRDPCIYGTFNIDLGKIEDVIKSFNRELVLNKEHQR